MEKGAKIKLNFSELLRSHCVPVEKRHPAFDVVSAAFGSSGQIFLLLQPRLELRGLEEHGESGQTYTV